MPCCITHLPGVVNYLSQCWKLQERFPSDKTQAQGSAIRCLADESINRLLSGGETQSTLSVAPLDIFYIQLVIAVSASHVTPVSVTDVQASDNGIVLVWPLNRNPRTHRI